MRRQDRQRSSLHELDRGFDDADGERFEQSVS